MSETHNDNEPQRLFEVMRGHTLATMANGREMYISAGDVVDVEGWNPAAIDNLQRRRIIRPARPGVGATPLKLIAERERNVAYAKKRREQEAWNAQRLADGEVRRKARNLELSKQRQQNLAKLQAGMALA